MSVEIGLALGGGAMRGMAHIGVLQVLEEHDIKVKYLTGCSIGAVVGSAYACGAPLDMLGKLALSLDEKDFVDVTVPRLGFIRGNRAMTIIRTLTHDMNFEQTKIPFAVNAVDLQSGECVTFNSGKIYPAVRASMAVPGVFEPANIGGRQLVDGGVAQRVPLKVAKAMGDALLVGVDVGYRGSERAEKASGTIDVIRRSLDLMEWEMAKGYETLADVMILPQVQHIIPISLRQAEECIALGRDAALLKVDEIIEKAGEREKASVADDQ